MPVVLPIGGLVSLLSLVRTAFVSMKRAIGTDRRRRAKTLCPFKSLRG